MSYWLSSNILYSSPVIYAYIYYIKAARTIRNIKMSKKIPFTYLIGWSKLDIWYYGVRYAKDCHPKDLFTTYFTSSKYVHAIIADSGLPDVIEVRRLFKTAKPALVWEQKVLRRLKVLNESKWLNKNIAGSIYYDAEVRQKMTDRKLGLKAVKKDGKHMMVAECLVETYLADGYERGGCFGDRSGPKNSNWGNIYSPEMRKKIGLAATGRPVSDKTRQILREQALADNPMTMNIGIENHKKAMNRRRYKVFDGEKLFDSIQHAAKEHNIPTYTVQYRCSGNRNGWHYEVPPAI
jgi:hypothetical protein